MHDDSRNCITVSTCIYHWAECHAVTKDKCWYPIIRCVYCTFVPYVLYSLMVVFHKFEVNCLYMYNSCDSIPNVRRHTHTCIQYCVEIGHKMASLSNDMVTIYLESIFHEHHVYKLLWSPLLCCCH